MIFLKCLKRDCLTQEYNIRSHGVSGQYMILHTCMPQPTLIFHNRIDFDCLDHHSAKYHTNYCITFSSLLTSRASFEFYQIMAISVKHSFLISQVIYGGRIHHLFYFFRKLWNLKIERVFSHLQKSSLGFEPSKIRKMWYSSLHINLFSTFVKCDDPLSLSVASRVLADIWKQGV